MSNVDRIVKVLGRGSMNKRRIDKEELARWVRSGLPYTSLEMIARKLRLGREETAAVLQIPVRTMARRKKEKKLSAVESDRVYRIAKVIAHAMEVFKDEEAVAGWFKEPILALGEKRPLDLMDTDIGVQDVDDVLGRIQFGVYS